jgi:hypothetical protein
VIVACTLYRNEIKLLFAPDPPVALTYQCSFDADQLINDGRIIEQVGFIPDRQGLQLLPASSGRLVLAFEKQRHQGCLLRIWFYGDKGSMRLNAITIYPDEGTPFRLAENGNHVGAVFDVSKRLQGCSSFQISFEAENRAPYPARVLDAVELVTGLQGQVKPSLPDLPKILGLIGIAYLIMVSLFSDRMTAREKIYQTLFIVVLLLAFYLRWDEVKRVSGTMLDEDARGYYGYAQKMQLTGDQGFYSAQFEKREPLFILMVKLFFALFGVSATHLRFVSFAFSLAVIYLTYRIGRGWFHEAVGLIAAFILSVHPYLIQLSARGLREEWFAALLLLFVYYGYVRSSLNSWVRAVVSGLIAGCILLTRSECLPMMVIILLLYPLLVRLRWNYAMATIAIVLSLSLWIPHQYRIYKNYGDFFYTSNQYARFYTNREFAGKPGFPTKEEIMVKGMYYGPKTTPLDYYWNLHTPGQLLYGSLAGFITINLRMPLSFISGRGNAETVIYAVKRVMQNHGMKEVLNVIRLAGRLVRDNLLANLMGLVILLSFLAGLLLMGIHHHWMIFFYLIIFQLHTSFLASLGLDQRLTIHSYPLIALCCGYCVTRLFKKETFSGLQQAGAH